MPLAWRLTLQAYASRPFDGEGAYLFGGRWNSPRVRMAYSSATLSLAVLELLAHLDGPPGLPFAAVRIDFDDALIERAPLALLPVGWNSEPPGVVSCSIGDAWVREGRSAVLEVPSVLVPIESNYLINPLHRDFARVRVSAPSTFAFDHRLFSRG